MRSWEGGASDSASSSVVLLSSELIFTTFGYSLDTIICFTLLLNTIFPPFSSTNTFVTLSRISSLSSAFDLTSSLSSLLASTKMVLASGNLGNFYLHVLLPPFLQDLLWPCQLVSSAILTASSPTMPAHLVQVTNVSVNLSRALSSSSSRAWLCLNLL